MRTLNQAKLRWILRELGKGELSVGQIARQQGVKPCWVRKLRKRFAGVPLADVRLEKCGRPAKPITKDERKLILETYAQTPLGATKMESFLASKGVRLPHNRIHRVLLDAGKAEPLGKTVRRASWVRYERPHSNDLWHSDFSEYEDAYLLAYLDDASRFITGYALLPAATTDSALALLKESARAYGAPKQLMTDHGAQFCADEEKRYRFAERLDAMGIEHIMSRVKHPQSNGKIERWFGTIKRMADHFGSLDLAVERYNNMPHLSLGGTPAEAYAAKRIG